MFFSQRVVSPVSSDSGSSTLSDLEGRRLARESRVRPWLANSQRVVPSGKTTGGGMPSTPVVKPTVTTAPAPAMPRSSIPTRPAARLPVAKSRAVPTSREPSPPAKEAVVQVKKATAERKPVSGLPVVKVAAGVVCEKKQSSRALAACDGAALVSRMPVHSQASKVSRVGTGASPSSRPPTSTLRCLGSGITKPGTLMSSPASSRQLPSVKTGNNNAGPGANSRDLPPARRPLTGKVVTSRSFVAATSSRGLLSARSGKEAAGQGVNLREVTPARRQPASKLQAPSNRASAQKSLPRVPHGALAGTFKKVPLHTPCPPSAVPGKTALKKKSTVSADQEGTGSKSVSTIAPRVKRVAFSTVRPQSHIFSRWQVPIEDRPQSCGCIDRCDGRSVACAGDRVAAPSKATWLVNQFKLQVEAMRLSASQKAKE